VGVSYWNPVGYNRGCCPNRGLVLTKNKSRVSIPGHTLFWLDLKQIEMHFPIGSRCYCLLLW
jgi:hypothetical protein